MPDSMKELRAAGYTMLRLLVVEDDEADQLAIRRCVSQTGAASKTDVVASAAAAMQHITGNEYDCVLLDYYIPGVEGSELLRTIREAAPEIPVVVFTGRGDEDIAVELMKSGAMDYIPKASLTPERLASGLRHAIELARSLDPNARAGLAVARRVRQQIRERLRDAFRIGLESQADARHAHEHLRVALVEHRRRDLHRAIDDVGELGRLGPELEAAACDARDVEQVVDDARQPAHRAFHQLDVGRR